MELNALTFSYLFLRLAPFILVCFFSLASIFNQDFKGLVYLVGLLLSCATSIMLSSVAKYLPHYYESMRPEICNMITIGRLGEVSALPLGQNVFGFTFCYLLWWILTNNFQAQNIPTLVFFPVLILFDFIWNMRNTCYTFPQLLASLAIGSSVGLLWAFIIESTNSNHLKYFSGNKKDEVCSKPAKSTFRCNVYRNGQLISKNIGGGK
jgi:hypothetical protein